MNNFRQKLTIKQKHLAPDINWNETKSSKDKQNRGARKYINNNLLNLANKPITRSKKQTVIVSFSRALIHLKDFLRIFLAAFWISLKNNFK